ncbi:MAG TPA: translation initiation factor IF-2 [Sneathiellales bacterium]|nr:translation initiation factor IF-2 [Sneathiellales bacterium]
MSEAKDPQDKKLSLSQGPLTLQLKKIVDTGQVRQSFSHGRSKAVVVERKKKRLFKQESGHYEEVVRTAIDPTAKLPESSVPSQIADRVRTVEQQPSTKGRVVLKTLTDDEKSARAHALKGALAADQEARQHAQEEAVERADEERRLESEKDAAELRRLEEEQRKKTEEDARLKAEEEASKRLVEEEQATATSATRKISEAEIMERARAKKATPVRRNEPRRRSGKLTVARALSGDEERQRSLASVRRAREREKRLKHGASPHDPPKKVIREVVVPDAITVQELASRMAVRAVDVIKVLMGMDVMATVNQVLDHETAELVVDHFGHRMKRISEADVEIGLIGGDDDTGDLVPRAPVVTVMGHVDHGKTSLLDALRKTDVVAGEAGGITQHIGAYQVKSSSGQAITFLDTPGHAAFSAMRSRGAQATDIVVLVVAADDGVMPQTVEAINHTKAAKVPMIVAINKIDKPGADANRIRQELLQHEIVCEDMGGDVLSVEISALKKQNFDKLEEAIALQSEVMELTANPERSAEGVVIEAKLDHGRGPLATVLVQRGTLKVGDIFVTGGQMGRVRALLNENGENVKEAGPSMPIEVLGLQGTPAAGDDFSVVENEARAREITEYRQRRDREQTAASGVRSTVEQMLEMVKQGTADELPLVIKADVQGSSEAIQGGLENMNTDEVAVRILHAGVGGITEADVTLASASQAPVIGFNVRATKKARDLADQEGVEIRYYDVIYDLIDEIKALLSGMLSPTVKENVIGGAEVLKVFQMSKVGKVAGCLVTDGLVRRGVKARILRDNIVIHNGNIAALQRFKDEVKEVKQGTECGLSFENYQDLKEGDAIEIYEMEEIARTL